MSDLVVQPPLGALVVFRDAGPGGLLGLCLRRGFRHVTVICQYGPDLWVVVDPLRSGLALPVVVGARDDLLTAGGAWTVAVEISGLPDRSLRHRWPVLTCVEVSKRILGIVSILTLTPYQLFLSLRKRGRVTWAA
jgi:hypothetical protein